jgi:hypothetical protein
VIVHVETSQVVTLCIPAGGYRRLGGACCFYHQDEEGFKILDAKRKDSNILNVISYLRTCYFTHTNRPSFVDSATERKGNVPRGEIILLESKNINLQQQNMFHFSHIFNADFNMLERQRNY